MKCASAVRNLILAVFDMISIRYDSLILKEAHYQCLMAGVELVHYFFYFPSPFVNMIRFYLSPSVTQSYHNLNSSKAVSWFGWMETNYKNKTKFIFFEKEKIENALAEEKKI